jgi:hypothetical protein
MHVKRQLEARLRQYVLGELDHERRVEIEERLIMDPDLFELLGPTEDELVEDYLENVLTPKEKAAFEQHFLTNEDRRWHLGFVRLMKENVVQRPSDDAVANAIAEGGSPLAGRSESGDESWASLARRGVLVGHGQMWAGALAASLVMLLAGSVWFVVRERGLSNELGRLQAEHQLEQRERRDLQTRLGSLSAQAQALQTELDSERRLRETAKPTGTRALIPEALLPRLQEPPLFVLATGLLRSGGSMARVAIPVNAPLIRLRLELPGHDHTLYRAVIYDAEAQELWAQSRLTAQAGDGGTTVTITVPSTLLPRGDYQLVVSGSDRGTQPERGGADTVRVTTP